MGLRAPRFQYPVYLFFTLHRLILSMVAGIVPKSKGFGGTLKAKLGGTLGSFLTSLCGSRRGTYSQILLGAPQLQPSTADPIKLETGLRPNSAEIPYTLLLRIEAVGFRV